jgi:CRP-like cAMP-binding protein
MASTASACIGNRLLAVLPSSDQKRIFASSEKVGLVRAERLHAPGDLKYVYFPLCGSISLVLPVGKSASLEVGLVGNEGMFGVPLTLDVPACPFHAVVQAPGAALRMNAAGFRRALGRSAALRERLDRYLCVRFTQLARRAACARFHVVEARLARWLLMTRDRAQCDRIELTHELLASMLGARRVGVTNAATELQRRGLISYRRGDVRILDVRSLKSASCGCYAADLATYKGLLG